MARIALTGSSGTIGRAIVTEALADGHELVCIDRVAPVAEPIPGRLSAVQVDMADYDRLVPALAGCDALIHMAAIPSPGSDPDHIVHNNNVVASYNALQAAAEAGIMRICQASSVNAIGLVYSRAPRFDYFPIDEQHADYNEEAYSLSKWICEQQADSFVRRHETMRIASMRFHWVLPDRHTARTAYEANPVTGRKELWGYTLDRPAARACLASLFADFTGHEVFYITAPDSAFDTPSRELAARFYPDVPIRGAFAGNCSFFSNAKAEKLLGWRHNA